MCSLYSHVCKHFAKKYTNAFSCWKNAREMVISELVISSNRGLNFFGMSELSFMGDILMSASIRTYLLFSMISHFSAIFIASLKCYEQKAI